MLSRYCRWFAASVIGVSLFGAVVAQELPPIVEPSSDGEVNYFDLTRSKDRLTQQIAERYLSLVKLQEWSSAKGTKISAKYVAHDPDLQWVKLAAVKGRGADRVVKEVKVPVEQLSKTCQSRVKQIATLQKKLDELAAATTDTAEHGQTDAGEFPGGDPGAPMTDERGVEPRRTTRPREPSANREARGPRANVPAGIPESLPIDGGDADPLGFGEIPVSTYPLGAGPIEFAAAGKGLPVGAVSDAVPADWATNYDAFHANLKVVTDERGEQLVDFGELSTLSQISKAAPGKPKPAKGTPAGAEPTVMVEWEAAFNGIRQTPESAPTVDLDLRPLPQPLQLEVRIDEKNGGSGAQDWATFDPGERVKFKGLIFMESPTLMVLYVREPQKVDAATSDPATEPK